MLNEALVRRTGHSNGPRVHKLTPESWPHETNDAILVQVEASLLGYREAEEAQILQLQIGMQRFEARLEGGHGLTTLPPLGSQLALTGIYALQSGNRAYGTRSTCELFLRSPDDVRIVARPPWWTLGRMLWLVATVTLWFAVILIFVVWRSRRKMLAEQQAHREAEARFAIVNQERNRLAGELHDTLEQTMAGVALQLDVGLMTLPASLEQPRKHIALAKSMVQRSQGEIRRSVWDLRSQMLDNSDLFSALTALSRQLSEGTKIRVATKIEGVARRLPESLEHHLLRIAQEALTNAVKHSQALDIYVTLTFEQQTVRLVVADAGRGFVPTLSTAAAPGHFGLMGMRERAKAMGGQIEIRSAPGSGTTITVIVTDVLDIKKPAS